jgi:hypothetical protein
VTTALIAPDDFWEPFERFSYSVFRLEVLQSYAAPVEDLDLAAFLDGKPRPSNPGRDKWTATIAANRDAGKTQQRVHVVTEPLTDYMRYELTWGYEPNAKAGEDIRIIPVPGSRLWPPLPKSDFCLFDSSELFAMIYGPDGTWRGAEPVSDPHRIVEACRWRDAALHHAVPWQAYISKNPDLERHLAL